MAFWVAPNAFLTPISRVRSVTLTNIIFIKPMAAPSNVIKPIMVAPAVTFCKLPINKVARLSDFTISKLSTPVVGTFLIFLKVAFASFKILSNKALFLVNTLIVKLMLSLPKYCLALVKGIMQSLSPPKPALLPLLFKTPIIL